MNRYRRCFALRRAAKVLHQGGIVAYPTEAVYGLGCDPLNQAAVDRLLAIKQRTWTKGLILIASDAAQLEPFIKPPTTKIRRHLDASWPGPVTWLLAARPEVPAWLRGAHDAIAVRVTAHPQAAALCTEFAGALVSTSANTAGQSPARSALQARLRCPDIDLFMHGATGGLTRPTVIRDAQTGATIRSGNQPNS